MSLEQLSLLDTAGMKVCEWYLVYHHRQPVYWFTKFMKPGFRHVELCRPLQFGPGIEDVVWLQLLPQFEMLDAEVCTDPRPPWVRCPNATVQKAVGMRPLWSVRDWFQLGPSTCVEVAKMALGVRAFWIRTPWQLYQYIEKRKGIVTSGRRRRQ